MTIEIELIQHTKIEQKNNATYFVLYIPNLVVILIFLKILIILLCIIYYHQLLKIQIYINIKYPF